MCLQSQAGVVWCRMWKSKATCGEGACGAVGTASGRAGVSLSWQRWPRERYLLDRGWGLGWGGGRWLSSHPLYGSDDVRSPTSSLLSGPICFPLTLKRVLYQERVLKVLLIWNGRRLVISLYSIDDLETCLSALLIAARPPLLHD